MLIGELSKKSGYSRDTLRFYEKVGLLDPNHRGPSNYREYNAEVFPLLKFIKRTQEMGFTLAEIKEMLPSQYQPYTCETVSENIKGKMQEIDEEINRLQEYKTKMHSLGRACNSDSKFSTCEGFESLWQG